MDLIKKIRSRNPSEHSSKSHQDENDDLLHENINIDVTADVDIHDADGRTDGLVQDLREIETVVKQGIDFDKRTVEYTEKQAELNDMLKLKIEAQEQKWNDKFENLNQEIQSMSQAVRQLVQTQIEKGASNRMRQEEQGMIGKALHTVQKAKDIQPDPGPNEAREYNETEDEILGTPGISVGAGRKPKENAYVIAVRNSKWLYPLEWKDDSTCSLYTWIVEYYSFLEQSELDLTPGERAMVLVRRLPHKYMARLLNLVNRETTKESFFDHVKLLVSNERHNEFSATEKFFEYNLKNQGRNFDIQECVDKLKNLAICLPVSRQVKERMVIDKLCTILPFYYQDKIRQEYRMTENNPNLTIVQKLWPCLSGDCMTEINAHYRNTYGSQVGKDKKVNNVVANGTDGTNGTYGQTDNKSRRCMRCGLTYHTSSKCPLYKSYATRICERCKLLLRINLYHTDEECKAK